MSEDVYRPRSINPNEIQQGSAGENPHSNIEAMQSAQSMRKAVAQETGGEFNLPEESLLVGGKMPPAFQHAMKQAQNQPQQQPQQTMPSMAMMRPEMQHMDGKLGQILSTLQVSLHAFEKILLPSRGLFYTNIPGELHLRPMTGAEEQILASPRIVQRGEAMDMIFAKCLQERINPADLLSPDRTYLLIYLRGISYSSIYEVEIKCPACNSPFQSDINLGGLKVNYCPEDLHPESLKGTLPKSGLSFSYRISNGHDELEINQRKSSRAKNFGDGAADDTIIHRTAMLINEIEGVTERGAIELIIRNLGVADLNYLRNKISNPPFGVDTLCGMICPMCTHDFTVDLPFEASFFSPRPKEELK